MYVKASELGSLNLSWRASNVCSKPWFIMSPMVRISAECHWERFKSGLQEDMALSGIGSDLLGELWGYAFKSFLQANSEAEIIGLIF